MKTLGAIITTIALVIILGCSEKHDFNYYEHHIDEAKQLLAEAEARRMKDPANFKTTTEEEIALTVVRTKTTKAPKPSALSYDELTGKTENTNSN